MSHVHGQTLSHSQIKGVLMSVGLYAEKGPNNQLTACLAL